MATGVALTPCLSSAFGVDFSLPPGSHQVMVDSSGKVVEGHLQVFAADGCEVATTSRTYDDETKHEAAAREFRQSQAVGLQSPKLLGPVRFSASRLESRSPPSRGPPACRAR